jgi:uncharacterized protein
VSASLLDVNVLVALFDPDHAQHEAAHGWFASAREAGWATCPITENGLTRILSNVGYHAAAWRPAQIIDRLSQLCAGPGHQFWPDVVSLRDSKVFAESLPLTARQITDAYLLALAVQRGGNLVTFDRNIPLGAVVGATKKNLTVLAA